MEIRKTDLREGAIATRAAFHADEKGWRVFLRAMGQKDMVKKVTRVDIKRLKTIGSRKR